MYTIHPPAFTATAESITKDTEDLLDSLELQYKDITSQITPSTACFANVLLPLAHADNEERRHLQTVNLYSDVSPDQGTQDAASSACSRVNSRKSKFAYTAELFTLIQAVMDKNEAMDEEDDRFLHSVYDDFIQRGASIREPSQRDRFQAIQEELDDCRIRFKKNLIAGHQDKGSWFTPEELEGIPAKSLGDTRQGSAENSGKVFVENLDAVLRSGRNSAARERARLNYYHRYKDNAPILREIVLLRDEAARILGFSSHAERRCVEKMADSPDTIIKFLDAVKAKVRPIAEEYLTRLRALKKADLEARGDQFDDHLFMWDELYYKTKLNAMTNPLSKDEISEYFPLEVVIMNMINIFNIFFGVDIQELDSHDRNVLSQSGKGSDLIWHESVRMFAVRDTNENQDFLGYLYLDLFERDDKASIATCINLLPGYQGTDRRHYPATVLCWDFSKPNPGEPKLLDHPMLVSLLHEFGHGIHDLVSKTKYARFHGPSGTPVDFGEAPSQLLENWCWDSSMLQKLSRHYSYLSPEYYSVWKKNSSEDKPQPPEVLPAAIVSSIISNRYVGASVHLLSQMAWAYFDLAVHHAKSHEDLVKTDISSLLLRIEREVCPLEGPLNQGDNWGCGEGGFGHIAISDYDAGYYAYTWSQVYADDMYHTFFKDDPLNVTEGQRYRKEVLEPGWSRDGFVIMKRYLGRDADESGFLKSLISP